MFMCFIFFLFPEAKKFLSNICSCVNIWMCVENWNLYLLWNINQWMIESLKCCSISKYRFHWSLCGTFWRAALPFATHIGFSSVWNQDKLQKEEKNTAVNLLKLNEGWRSILRQTRAAELRKDITVLSQTFERQLDGLNNVIKVSWGPTCSSARPSHRTSTCRLSVSHFLSVSLFCRIWSVTCRRRSVSRLRCGGFTCSTWSVCGLSRTNGWWFCSSSGRTPCTTWAPGSDLRGRSEEPQRPLQTEQHKHDIRLQEKLWSCSSQQRPRLTG